MFDPTNLPGFTAGPVDWFASDFGTHTHAATEYGTTERSEDQ